MFIYIIFGQKEINKLFEKDGIKNPNTNKVYNKNSLIANNLSAIFLIIHYYNTCNTQLGLVTKKKKRQEFFQFI